jgi:hypothetical protein
MDSSKESLVGGMTGGMMGDMMCPRDPREILSRLIQSEQMEIPVYNQLIQGAPSSCLRQMFALMCKESAMKVQKLCALAEEFGFGAIVPGMGPGPGYMANPPGAPPLFFSEGEKPDKK